MFIENMLCPKCGSPLVASLNGYQDPEAGYCEVEFTCTNGHKHFARVKVEDLIEAE